MISTGDLSLLPDIDRLKALMQSLALLDAILCPEWEYRYHSFNAHWDIHEAMASIRDGSGDDLVVLFTPAGAVLKGFAHESPMSPYAADPPCVWPGVLDQIPAIFTSFLSEPAFKMTDTTFCIWRTYADTAWQHGVISFPAEDDPDGSGALLAMLDGEPRTYQQWAESYYERAVPLDAVTHIYQHQPLTAEIVTALNANVSLADVEGDRVEIGYP